MLEQGSSVVVSSALVRTALAIPLIRRRSLADLVLKARKIKQRTGRPVHFVTTPGRRAKGLVKSLLDRTRDLNFTPTPFHDTAAVKKTLLIARNTKWQDEWTNSGQYFSSKGITLPHAAQTKLWFPTVDHKEGITTLGRPTLGELIQFITGHGWFGRHRAKIEPAPRQCRLCKNRLEDPEHI